MKNTTPKVNVRGHRFAEALEHFKGTGRPFTVERTGYSATIHTNTRRYHFNANPVRPYIFGIYNKLKAQVEAAGIPPEDPAPLYFDFSGAHRTAALPYRAWSADLSNAYAQALFNLRIIDGPLFLELKKLPKADRLRVVGMLATTKSYVYYNGQDVVHMETVTSPTRGAFMAACRFVGEVMENVIPWPGYLLFWVDGAFFDHPSAEALDYFAAEGFPAKLEELEDLKWSRSRRYLFFTKDGRRKYLTVPQGKKPAAAWITDLLSRPADGTT